MKWISIVEVFNSVPSQAARSGSQRSSRAALAMSSRCWSLTQTHFKALFDAVLGVRHNSGVISASNVPRNRSSPVGQLNQLTRLRADVLSTYACRIVRLCTPIGCFSLIPSLGTDGHFSALQNPRFSPTSSKKACSKSRQAPFYCSPKLLPPTALFR